MEQSIVDRVMGRLNTIGILKLKCFNQSNTIGLFKLNSINKSSYHHYQLYNSSNTLLVNNTRYNSILITIDILLC